MVVIANTVNYDNSNDNGNPGTPNQSRYLACFTIEGKGVDTYYKYSFPVTSQSSGCGYVAHPWNGLGNSVGNLEQQNFKSGSRASDGKLIVPVDAQTVGVRFDASGSDNDDWKLKSLKAYFTAVDGTRPCVMSVSAASGLYGYRDKVTICLQFSEIVKVNSAPTLNTNFGSFSYDGGSGTSVLYFSRTMNSTALGPITSGLTINSISYSSTGIQDLAGNYYEGKYRNLNTSLSAVNLPDVNYEGRGLLQRYGLDGSTHTDNFMRLNATYMFPAYTGQLPEGKEFDCYLVGNTAYRPGDAIVVNQDYAAYPQFKWRKYPIVFKNYDGTVLQDTEFEHTSTPVYTNATPTKPSTAQYTFHFAGWAPAIETVTSNATYTAQYTNTVNSYTVTWIDGNDSELKVDTLEYGETPDYVGDTPTKTATAQYTYHFAGWAPAIETVTSNATYFAQFTNTVNKYAITWKGDGDNELATYQVPYGDTPAYTNATPVKAATAQYTYHFSGWEPEIETVTSNATYTAQFTNTVNKYAVTWIDGNGGELKTDTLEYGQTPSYVGDTPTKAATPKYTYAFDGTWTPAIEPVTSNAIYTAQFGSTVNEYAITWIDGDGNELATYQVPYDETPAYTNATPTKTATAQYTYYFVGWDPAVESVTGNATYTAQFTHTVNRYTVTWSIDGAETSEEYDYGATPAHADPTKPATTQYTYHFAGWEPAIETVTGNATYVAQFTNTVNRYAVTWLDEDGSVLATYQVPYGETPVYTNATPVKATDATNAYVFAGWTPEVAPVSTSAAYMATFSAVSLWQDLAGKLAAGGTVVLSNDVVATSADSALTVPAGVSATLDLNGHVVDRALVQAADNGEAIRVLGSLTLTNSVPGSGAITGGNTTQCGGGVRVVSNGCFTMNGGAITGNSAALRGGGVFLEDAQSRFLVSGAPRVVGNVAAGLADAVASDIEFGSAESLVEVVGPLAPEALLGIVPDVRRAVTANLGGNGGLANFFSDDAEYTLALDADGEACIVPPTYALTYVPQDHVTVSVYSTTSDVSTAAGFSDIVIVPTNFASAFSPGEWFALRFDFDPGWFLDLGDWNFVRIVADGSGENALGDGCGFFVDGTSLYLFCRGPSAPATLTVALAPFSRTVTFQNHDGTELQSGPVGYGVQPAYTNATPTRAAPDGDHYYAFTGWTPALAPVVVDIGSENLYGTIVYTATYELHEVEKFAVVVDPNVAHGEVGVNVVSCDNGQTYSQGPYTGPVPAGTPISISYIPDPGYGFVSWSVVDTNGVPVEVGEDGEFTMPASDVTVSATFAALLPVSVESDAATSNRVGNLFLLANGVRIDAPGEFAAAPGAIVDLWIGMNSFVFAPTVTVATASGAAVETYVENAAGEVSGWWVVFVMPDEPVAVTLSTVLVDYPALSLGENGVSTNRAYFTFTPATPGRYSFTAAGGDAYCGVCNEAGSCLMSDNDGCVTLDNGVRYYVEYCDYGESTDRSISVTLVEEMFSVTVDPDMQNGEVEVLVVNYEDEHGSYGTSQYTGPVFAGTIIEFVAYPYSGYGLDSWSVVDTNGVPVAVDKWGHYIMPASDVTVSAVFAEALPVVVQSDVATSNMVNSLSLRANGVWGYYPDDFAAAPGATVDLWFGINSFFASPTATVATASGAVVASNVEYLDGDGGGWSVRFTMPDEPVVVTLSTVPADYTELHEGTNEVDVPWGFFTFVPETTGFYSFAAGEGDSIGVYDSSGDYLYDVADSFGLVAGERYYVEYYAEGDEGHDIVVTKTSDAYAVLVDPAIEHGTVTVYEVGTWRHCSGAVPAGTEMRLAFTPDPGYGLASWSIVDTNGVPVEVDEEGCFTMPASDVTVSATFARTFPVVVESDAATSNKVNGLTFYANGVRIDNIFDDFSAAPGATVALQVEMESIAIAPTATVATASGVAVASSVEYSGGGVGGWIVRFTMPDEPVVVTLSTVPADYTELHEGTNEVDVSWNCFTFTPTTTGYYTFETSNGEALWVDVYDAFGADVYSLPLLAGQKYYLNCFYIYTDVEHGVVVTKTDDVVTTYSIAVDPNLVGGTVSISYSEAPAEYRVYLTAVLDDDEYVGVMRATWMDGGEVAEIQIEQDEGAYYFTMPAGNVIVTATFARARPISFAVADERVFLYELCTTAGSAINPDAGGRAVPGSEVVVYFFGAFGYDPSIAFATDSGSAVESHCRYSGYRVWELSFTMPDEPVTVSFSLVPENYPKLSLGTNTVDYATELYSFTPSETGVYRFDFSGYAQLAGYDSRGEYAFGSYNGGVGETKLLVAGETFFVQYVVLDDDGGTSGTIVIEKTDETVTTHQIAVDPNLVGGTVKASVTNAPSGYRVYLSPIPATGYVYVDDSMRIISGSATNYVFGSDGEAFYFWMPDSDVTVTAQFTRSLVVGDNAINIAGINQTGDNPPDKVFYFVPPESGTYRFQMPVAQNCMFFVTRLKVNSTIAAEYPDLAAGGFDFTVALNGGEAYRFDINYVFDPLSTTLTITAPQPQVVYPTYLDGANDLVKSNYVAWAAQYGADTASVYETAFLLGIDPATAIPDGAALLKVVDFAITNKVLHLELASDVCNLFQPAGLSGTPALCNGVLTLELAFDLGASSPSGFGIGTFAVPVTIDASGHAVIDIEFTSSNMPAALFLRPAIGFKIVNFAE